MAVSIDRLLEVFDSDSLADELVVVVSIPEALCFGESAADADSVSLVFNKDASESGLLDLTAVLHESHCVVLAAEYGELSVLEFFALEHVFGTLSLIADVLADHDAFPTVGSSLLDPVVEVVLRTELMLLDECSVSDAVLDLDSSLAEHSDGVASVTLMRVEFLGGQTVEDLVAGVLNGPVLALDLGDDGDEVLVAVLVDDAAFTVQDEVVGFHVLDRFAEDRQSEELFARASVEVDFAVDLGADAADAVQFARSKPVLSGEVDCLGGLLVVFFSESHAELAEQIRPHFRDQSFGHAAVERVVESSKQQGSISAVHDMSADSLQSVVAADLAGLELAEKSKIGLCAVTSASSSHRAERDLVQADEVFVLAVRSERQGLESFVAGLSLQKVKLLGGLRSRAKVAEKDGDLGYLILVFHIRYF